MSSNSTRQSVAIVAAVITAVIVAVWLFGRSSAPPEPAPQIVSSPTVESVPADADPNAIGLCALNRVSGVLEGQIIGIVPAQGGARYHVQALDDPRQAFHVRPEAVLLDHCERAIQADPSSPVRVEEDAR